MANTEQVLEYKCPCCDAPLKFGLEQQKMVCEYCDNTFEMEAVIDYNKQFQVPETPENEWETPQSKTWTQEEQENICTYTCPSCGGELIADANTAATFCPFCDNPAVIQGRVSGGIKPDKVLPFKKSKEEAQQAFRDLCKGKPLLPKGFSSDVRVEKITGMYVPFWLYNCTGKIDAHYKATRVSHWSDRMYDYTRTDHYSVHRSGVGEFCLIPMDASKKLSDVIMESIEPYDYSQMVDFDTAYLSGYFADKYDVEAEAGYGRIKQRVDATMDAEVAKHNGGYTTCVPVSKNIRVEHGNAEYVLLPAWMLYTRYKDQTYVFAMNGQTGKITGSFPICPKQSAKWFTIVAAAATLVGALVQLLLL